jgi:hypothetical protein
MKVFDDEDNILVMVLYPPPPMVLLIHIILRKQITIIYRFLAPPQMRKQPHEHHHLIASSLDVAFDNPIILICTVYHHVCFQAHHKMIQHLDRSSIKDEVSTQFYYSCCEQSGGSRCKDASFEE